MARQAAEREGERRHGTDQRAQAVTHRQVRVQAMRQSDAEHRDEGQAGIEHVRTRAEAQDAQQGEAQLGCLDCGYRRLEQRGTQQVGERHLQRAAGDQQPGDAEYGGVTEGQDGDRSRGSEGQREPEPWRCQHGAGSSCRDDSAGRHDE